jgi:uncharacterized membrane protein YqjE
MKAAVQSQVPEASEDGLFSSLARLAQLELELGIAETRQVLISAAIAVGVAVASAIAAVASLVVLVAAAFAPLFGAAWEHLVIAGGGILLLSVAAIAWSVHRLRTLDWPRLTLASLEENWRWLGAQIRSRLTLR